MTMTTTQSTYSNPVVVPSTPSEAHQKATGFTFSVLLNQALTEPGIISQAYSRFHRYSLSNQILAAMQLQGRGMPLAPIASYNHWLTLGRKVRKGEKALALFMPVSIKQREKHEETGEEAETGKVFTRFKLARNWFSVDQTEGETYAEPQVIPNWDAAQAFGQLGISRRRFEMVNGNVQGYALDRTIAINPLAALPHKTRFHEVAHIVLGHTAKVGCWDTATLPRQIEEAEAEGVAFLLCALLDLPGLAESRGYIQSWMAGGQLPEKSTQRIFSAAQAILAAGKSK